MNVILISGKKQRGKDTVAKLLQEKIGGKVVHFADPLKRILATTLEMDIEQLDALKLVDDHYRVMLQRLGTEAMKPEFGDDVWAKAMVNYLSKPENQSQYIIIPDWRFLVESDAFPGAYKVRVNRLALPFDADQHPSEIELDDFPDFDYVLENPAEYKDLILEVDKLIDIVVDFFDPEPVVVVENATTPIPVV